MIIDENWARVEFVRMSQADVCPALTDTEQTDILSRFKRGSLWVAGTAFNLGDRVIPTLANRNGHRFIAMKYVATGTDRKSGATEPSWTIARDGEITDGSIIWQEDGWDWDAVLWDLSGAAQQAWLVKAAKASVTSDTQVGDLRISSSQLFDHCMAMAKSYQVPYVL